MFLSTSSSSQKYQNSTRKLPLQVTSHLNSRCSSKHQKENIKISNNNESSSSSEQHQCQQDDNNFFKNLFFREQQKSLIQNEFHNRRLLNFRQEAEIELKLAKWVLENQNQNNNSNQNGGGDARSPSPRNPQHPDHHDDSSSMIEIQHMRSTLHKETSALKEFHQQLVSDFAKKEEKFSVEREMWKSEVMTLRAKESELRKKLVETEEMKTTSDCFIDRRACHIPSDGGAKTPPPTSSYVRFATRNSNSSSSLNSTSAVMNQSSNSNNKYKIMANFHQQKQQQQIAATTSSADDQSERITAVVVEAPSPLSTISQSRSMTRTDEAFQICRTTTTSQNITRRRSTSNTTARLLKHDDDEEDAFMNGLEGSPLSPNSLAML